MPLNNEGAGFRPPVRDGTLSYSEDITYKFPYEAFSVADWNTDSAALTLGIPFTIDKDFTFTAKVSGTGLIVLSAVDADGDAITQTEINSAITTLNTAGGGTVRLLEGTYTVTGGGIVLKSNVTLVMDDGVTIENNTSTSDYGAINAIGTSGTHLENVAVRGGKVSLASGNTHTEAVVEANYVDNLIVDGLQIESMYYQGIHVNNSSGRISDCLLSGGSPVITSSLTGISIEGDSEMTVTGNRIEGFVANATDVTGIDAGSSDTRVLGNRITGIQCTATLCGINLASGKNNCDISNNCLSGVWSNSSQGTINILSSEDNILVTDNILHDNGQLIDRGGCESTTPPMIFGETVPDSSGTGTYQRVADPHEGTYAWELISDGSAVWRRFTDGSSGSDMHGLIPGLEYTATFVAKRTAGMASTEAVFRFLYYNSGTWTTDNTYITSDDFAEYSTTVTIPATATGWDAYLIISSAATSGEKLVIDNIRLYPTGTGNEHENQYKES